MSMGKVQRLSGGRSLLRVGFKIESNAAERLASRPRAVYGRELEERSVPRRLCDMWVVHGRS